MNDTETTQAGVEAKTPAWAKIDLLDLLIGHEEGTLDSNSTLILFGELVRTGQAWTLQGHYGREAATLIDSGLIDERGNIDWNRADPLDV